MLVIRDAQLAALRQLAIDRFAADLVKHLLRHFPAPSARVGGEPEVREFVRKAIERAARYGIETTGSITVFAELLLQYGENFERSPLRSWIAKMLSNQALPGDAKIEAIRDRINEQTGGRTIVPF
jgi:hypothetical protein